VFMVDLDRTLNALDLGDVLQAADHLAFVPSACEGDFLQRLDTVHGMFGVLHTDEGGGVMLRIDPDIRSDLGTGHQGGDDGANHVGLGQAGADGGDPIDHDAQLRQVHALGKIGVLHFGQVADHAVELACYLPAQIVIAAVDLHFDGRRGSGVENLPDHAAALV